MDGIQGTYNAETGDIQGMYMIQKGIYKMWVWVVDGCTK